MELVELIARLGAYATEAESGGRNGKVKRYRRRAYRARRAIEWAHHDQSSPQVDE